MVKFVKENYDFKNVYTSTAGCTVSVHCGPNTLGILYIDKATKMFKDRNEYGEFEKKKKELLNKKKRNKPLLFYY